MAIPDVTGSTIPRHGKPQAGGGDCKCRLTKADRLGIERFLSFANNSSVAYSQLMLDILHQKLQVAVAIEGAAPSDVATFGSYISCLVDEKEIECGVLSFGLVTRAGEIPIHSLLGATLIGMSAGQRTKLLSEDGTTRSLVITQAHDPDAESIMQGILTIEISLMGTDASGAMMDASVSWWPEGMNAPFYMNEEIGEDLRISIDTLSLEEEGSTIKGSFSAHLCRKDSFFAEADTDDCLPVEGHFDTALMRAE